MTEAYQRGRRAFAAGLKDSDCPHAPSISAPSNDRLEWLKGWYDGWRIAKYGPNEDDEIL